MVKIDSTLIDSTDVQGHLTESRSEPVKRLNTGNVLWKGIPGSYSSREKAVLVGVC